MAGGSTPPVPGRPEVEVDVDGRRLRLGRLDKVLYPEAGVTKADVVDYYARVAPVLLPHLARRALTMVRCPDGVGGTAFFEKRCPGHRPGWVPTALVDGRDPVRHCVIGDRASLVWAANLAALELHVPQVTVDDPEHPTAVVLDLDPGEPAGVLDCARVALDVRDLLLGAGLTPVVKTSGSKGLHVAAPVLDATAAQAKALARAVGTVLTRRAPDAVTLTMSRRERTGRVLVDWSQNDRRRTTVVAYSLRAAPRPLVSTPVTWEEVAAALDAADPGALAFEAAEVLGRVEALGDLYAGALGPGTPIPR